MTPKSPKGDFFKLLIFSSSPLGAGVKMVKISSLKAFYTALIYSSVYNLFIKVGWNSHERFIHILIVENLSMFISS
jgi:hypothetical protein